MITNAVIKTETLDDLTQIVLYEQKDLFGALKYLIKITKDGQELTQQLLENEEVALNLFDGFKEYYSKSIAKLNE